MMRKMLLVGALFTTLINVSSAGAWAMPSTAKAKAFTAMPSNNGCPPMSAVANEWVSDERGGTTEQPRPVDPDNPLPFVPPAPGPVVPEAPGPAPTPCDLATARLAVEEAKAAEEQAKLETDQAEADLADLELQAALNNPQATAQQIADARTEVNSTALAVRISEILADLAELDALNAQDDKDIACAGQVEEVAIPELAERQSSFFLNSGEEGSS